MQKTPAPRPFCFTGSGSEYCQLWLTNIALSLLTMGIYSAWAKVRRLKYFYNNTRLDGAVFDYHARPIDILRGRALAMPMLVLAGLADLMSPFFSIAIFLAVVPWMAVESLRFNAAHTTYRGLRFRFVGSMGEGYRVMSLGFLGVLLSVGILYPRWRYRMTCFVYNNLRYADYEFECQSPLRAFVGTYYLCSAWMMLGLLVGALISVALGVFSAQPDVALVSFWGVFYGLGVMGAASFIAVRNRNLLFSHLCMVPPMGDDRHRFLSAYELGSYFRLKLVNLLSIVLTLGLFRPFAAVRNARYQAENTAWLLHLNLGYARSVDSDMTSAFGAEATDGAGWDVGL